MLKNPILFSGGLPPFDEIKATHVGAGMRELLAELARDLEVLEANADPTWDAAIEAPTALGERLGRAWGVVGHLMGVRNSDELRAAYEEVQPEIVAFGLRIAQSPALFAALEGLAGGEAFAAMDETQKRIIDSSLRDARLSGVALRGAEKENIAARAGGPGAAAAAGADAGAGK